MKNIYETFVNFSVSVTNMVFFFFFQGSKTLTDLLTDCKIYKKLTYLSVPPLK